MTQDHATSPGTRFFASPGDFVLAASALGWLVRARLVHLRRPAPELLARLRRPGPADRPRRPLPLARVSRAIAAWSRRAPWRSDCMIQALAAKMWLDRRGLPTEMRLGAARSGDGALDAHVWILSDGEVVTGGPLDRGDWTAFAPAGTAVGNVSEGS
ncbi:MAG: lasso peptide biosynthesis B2 protein [Pseudomonadota bacterium]